jgi:hypothetical protein
VLGRNSPMPSYNKATQFLRNARATRFAPKGRRLNQSARRGELLLFALCVNYLLCFGRSWPAVARLAACWFEHFAHLRRRTLRNERDKVIIKIGSAD